MQTLHIKSQTFTFYFPFHYRVASFMEFCEELPSHGFHFFHLEKNSPLSQFFYPFVEDKLFPSNPMSQYFNRFEKQLNASGQFMTPFETFDFCLNKLNILLFPFGIGVITLCIELKNEQELTSVLHFAEEFRLLMDGKSTLYIDGQKQNNYRKCWIEKELLPFINRFKVETEKLHKHSSSMPFFEDARMFVTALLESEEQVQPEHLYRIAHIDGRNAKGKPFISTTNDDYIHSFLQQGLYSRWAPHLNTITCYQAHMHITDDAENFIEAYKTTNFYTVLIHYFYKMMLLKLTFEHSEISWEDRAVVDELIEEITMFSSRYYFDEVAVRSVGRETGHMLRKHFRIDEQYTEIKKTLQELYRVEEDRAQDRQNELLFMLTIFSMISGIYGMNLVIEDWKNGFTINDLKDYHFLEWIALFVAILGLSLSVILVGRQLYANISNFIQRKKRQLEK